MLFTARFTALAFTVVAATFCQVIAKPAPVEASSNSKDALVHGRDTIDANITRVGQPMDSATPSPDAAYNFEFSMRTVLGGSYCSQDPSDLGSVFVEREHQCTRIPVATGRNVLCLRTTIGSGNTDPRRVIICRDDNCGVGCSRLSDKTSLPDNFFSTNSPRSIYVV